MTGDAIPKTIKEHRYSAILGNIWRKVHIENGMFTIVFCGKRGKGKSCSMAEWARVLDRRIDDKNRFKPENIKFDATEFLDRLIGDFPRGTVHVLDDAGLHLYKSDALKDVLKKVSKVLQNIRYKNPIIMMSLPHFEQLMKDARTMTDLYIEMQGIDLKRNLAFGKIQNINVQPFSGKIYRPNIVQSKKEFSPKFGLQITHWEKRPYLFNKPPDDFLKEYERIKKILLDKLNKKLVNSIKRTTEKEIGENGENGKIDFPKSVEYCRERIQKFVSEKGKIDVASIMMETSEEGEQLFSMDRAKLIAQVLRKEDFKPQKNDLKPSEEKNKKIRPGKHSFINRGRTKFVKNWEA